MSALVARWLALPPNLRGILWVALSGLLFALLNVFTLIPAQHLNPYVMAFLRYFFGALFLLPVVFRLGLYRSLHTNRLGLHISRGAIHTAGMMLWFVALPLTTLAEITALGFTGPIFVTIGAALFLAEDVRLRRWIAVIVGFVGAMIIIRPGFGDDSSRRHLHPGLDADLLGLEPDLQGAGPHRLGQHHRDLAEHRDRDLRRALRDLVLADADAGSTCCGSWRPGLAGTLGHICQQRGYQLADITLLQPIGFLSLIWNTLLGYFLFFQQPDVWTFVGAAVIFASALYISHREAVRRAQIKTADRRPAPRPDDLDQPPVTLMWRGTAGPVWRRSMMKSWPLGLRAIASVIAWSSTSSLSEARSGARRSAASSWPRHM